MKCGGCCGTRRCAGQGEHEVAFFSSGEKRAATLTLPGGDARPAVAVLLHDFLGHRNDPPGLACLAESLAAAGIASLRFDFQGCGESGPAGVLCPSTRWTEDALAAVSFAESLECVDSRRLAVVGLGVGAGVAVQAAAMDERMAAVVALYPIVDGREWLRGLWTAGPGEEAWQTFVRAVEEDRRDRSATGDSRIVPMEDIVPDANGAMTHAYLSSADSLLRFRPTRVAHHIAPRPVCVVTGPAEGDHADLLHEALGEPRERRAADVDGIAFRESGAGDPSHALVIEWLRRALG